MLNGWQLNLSRLKGLSPYPFGRIAVESGTCRGSGARALAKAFESVFTIELSPELAAQAKARSGEFPQIQFLQGNSAEVLRQILPSLPSDQPIFFFLDAHWSGDQTVLWREGGWQGYGLDTAHLGPRAVLPSGPQQCPLAEELRAIAELCRSPALVLVDDFKNLPPEGPGLRDQTFPGEDWSHLSRKGLAGLVEARLETSHYLEEPARWYFSLSSLPVGR
jgi:hypothetical protein